MRGGEMHGGQEQAFAAYARLFAAGEVLVCELDLEGRFVAVNPAMAALLGYSADALRGSSYIDFVHPDDRGAAAGHGAVRRAEAILRRGP